MRTICCRICGAFHKRRKIGKKVEFCKKCGQPVCSDHVSTVVNVVATEKIRRKLGKDATQVKERMCQHCRAEEALTV